jgi:DNA-binding response OmpR family regulator
MLSGRKPSSESISDTRPPANPKESSHAIAQQAAEDCRILAENRKKAHGGKMQRPPLGELFVQLRLLTPDEVSSVLKRMQKGETGRFGATALALGLVDHEGLAKALAQQFGLRFVSSERIQRLAITESTLELLPAKFMREHLMVPTFLDPESRILSLLTADPTAIPSLRAAQEHATAQRLRLFVGPEPAIRELIDQIVPDAPSSEEKPDETEDNNGALSPKLIATLPRSKAIVLEPDMKRLGALRAVEEFENNPVDFAHDPEQVASLLKEGGVDRIIYRKGLSDMVEPYLPAWRRIAPGLNAAPVDGFGPSQQSGGLHAAGCRFLIDLLEFVLLASESKNMDARSRVRRTARLAKQVSNQLGLPQIQTDAILIAALLGELDQMSLVRGIVADDTLDNTQSTRFELARALVNPLDPPYDLDGLFAALERKRAGQESDQENIPADVLFSVRAIVEKGRANESNPEKILGAAAESHHPAILGALEQVLRRDALRGRLVTAGTGGALSTPTIVIAEREAALVTALEVRLGQAGFETVVVADGESALRETHALLPAAVIANMRLPRRDGLALVMELKNTLDTEHIPVILLTNRSSAADVNRGLEIGAEEVLEKPINVQVLITRIRKAIARSGKQTRTASLSGRLAELSIAELLQTLHLAGKTARVNVNAGLVKGSLGILDGNVLTAYYEDKPSEEKQGEEKQGEEKQGEEAFYELIALPQGRFEVLVGEAPEGSNLTESTEFLLLEALRRLDERRRIRD